MLSGDNSIIKQAGNAKTQTDIAQEKEILEQATVVAMGKSKYGNVEKQKLEEALENLAKNKTNVTDIVSRIYVEFTESKRFYKVDVDGNYTELGQNYIIPTPITAKQLYNQEDTSYIGAYVINYDCKSNDGISTDTDKRWRILYSNEDTIYLIASKPIDFSYIPQSKNGKSVSEGKLGNGSRDYDANIKNVLSDYIGSQDITDERLKKLNNDYFNVKNYSSNNNNLKATAYMMDISENVWGNFAGKYAEYAIGGPTLEQICASYNKKNNTENFQAKANSEDGYYISMDNGENFQIGSTTYYNFELLFNSGNYLISSPNGVLATDWWKKVYLHYVRNGFFSNGDTYGEECGFRPVVCLKSSVWLEKNADGNFSIIE